MDALQINVYVGDKCSRQCPRCYYPKGTTIMTEEQADKTAKWMVQTYNEVHPKMIQVHFLGGEPVEALDRVFYIIDYINNNMPEGTDWISMNALALFTNGDLLTKENLTEIKKRKIKVVLNPTYDTLEDIEKKIDLVKSVCGGCSLAIALDELNLARLPELTRLCVAKNVHMRPNRLYDGANIPGYVERYQEQMHKMMDIILAADVPWWPDFLMESTIITWEGVKNPNFCGKYFLVIDPNGDIRSCNADMETVVGHIDTTHFKDIKFPHRWSCKGLPECEDCEWKTWCQGGCPFTRKLTFGTYDHKSAFCEAFKSLFPKLFELNEKYKKWRGNNGPSYNKS